MCHLQAPLGSSMNIYTKRSAVLLGTHNGTSLFINGRAEHFGFWYLLPHILALFMILVIETTAGQHSWPCFCKFQMLILNRSRNWVKQQLLCRLFPLPFLWIGSIVLLHFNSPLRTHKTTVLFRFNSPLSKHKTTDCAFSVRFPFKNT